MGEKSDSVADKMADLLLDMVCQVDAEGNYLFVSAASEKLLGYRPEEMVGRNMLEFLHPDDRDRTLAAAQKVMNGEPHIDFENRYIRKDGGIAEIMWSARWFEPDGVRLAVARDVTAQKRSARRQEAMFGISEAAQTSRDVTGLLRAVHGIVTRFMPAECFFVALVNGGGTRITFPFYYDGRERRRDAVVLHEGLLVTEVISRGKGLVAAARGRDCALAESDADSDARNWLGAAMGCPDGIMGAVVMRKASSAFGYGEQDLELLRFVATQLASAIERRRQEDRLLHMAHHDSLTSLPNRALFRDRMDMALRRARREKEMVGLLYLDLRDFKDVNDKLGHVAGDAVLAETARRLVAALRDSDTVARLGGDEFTALIANIHGRGDVETVAAKLRRAVAEPLEVDGKTLSLTVDIGAALYPDDGTEFEALLRAADTGMYRSKRNLA